MRPSWVYSVFIVCGINILFNVISGCDGKFVITPQNAGDEAVYPGYNHALMDIFDISDRQYDTKLILEDDPMPEFMNNGGTYVLGWKPFFNDTTAVMIYCAQRFFFCFWTLFAYDPNAQLHNWKHIADSKVQYVYQNSMSGFHPFKGEDPRIILSPSKKRLLIIYNNQVHFQDTNEGFRATYCSELTYDATDNALYLNRLPVHLDVSHHIGRHHEKNWSPFFHVKPPRMMRKRKLSLSLGGDRDNGNDNSYDLLFIHASDPHRVLRPDTDDVFSMLAPLNVTTPYWSTAPTMNMSIISAGQVNKTWVEGIWKWGWPIRGGTVAELLPATPFGPKYLTVFHTSGRVLSPKLSTYFMGIYLFDVSPPFNITHVSKEPLIANSMYNDTYGWCTRSGFPDYSVFPVGVSIHSDANRLYVSWGKNNKASRMLTLNLSALFHDHLTYLL
jgi:hypothetical protein